MSALPESIIQGSWTARAMTMDCIRTNGNRNLRRKTIYHFLFSIFVLRAGSCFFQGRQSVSIDLASCVPFSSLML